MNFIVNYTVLLIHCLVRLSASASFQNNDLEEGKIVGGHESKPYSHPYLVSLQMRFLWIRMHVCGGSILNERWVLTAGHCVKESWLIRWLPMDAVAGAHHINYFGSTVQINAVEERIPHPLYPGSIGPYDIAVLRVKTPFYFTKEVQPINLPYDFKTPSDSLTLAGWGALRTTYFIPDLPNRLQEVNVKYISYEECYKAIDEVSEENEYNPLDKDANICTGPMSGGIAACNGDSGGPLIQFVSKQTNEPDIQTTEKNDEDYDSTYNEIARHKNNVVEEGKANTKDNNENIPIVLGIVSWGISPCGYQGAPTVYTKVSQYMDFINMYIKS